MHYPYAAQQLEIHVMERLQGRHSGFKTVYQSPTEEAALMALDQFAQTWDDIVPTDQQKLAYALGESEYLLCLCSRDTQSHLYHQCDRVIKQRNTPGDQKT